MCFFFVSSVICIVPADYSWRRGPSQGSCPRGLFHFCCCLLARMCRLLMLLRGKVWFLFLSLPSFRFLSIESLFRFSALGRAAPEGNGGQGPSNGDEVLQQQELQQEQQQVTQQEQLALIMDIEEFFETVLKRPRPSDPRVAEYDLDSLEASGRIMLLKREDPGPDLVVIAQLLLERVVPVFLCHDPRDVLIHQAGWIREATVERRFPDIPHAKHLLDFLQELGLCRTTLVGDPPQRASFFPTLVQEDEGWWGDTTSHNWQWYCGVRVQVPDDKGHKLPPSLLCRLIVALQERFKEFEVRVSKRAGVVVGYSPSIAVSSTSRTPRPVHIRGPHVGDCRVEVCVVRNDVDEFGRYLRFLDVAERWKRRPEGAEEWAQAGKLRDEVLLELEGIYREWFGELPLETLFLGEFDASSGPRPVAQVVALFFCPLRARKR